MAQARFDQGAEGLSALPFSLLEHASPEACGEEAEGAEVAMFRFSFWRGFVSVLSVFVPIPSPPYFRRQFSKPPLSDNEAIRRDWEMVASDLRAAYNREIALKGWETRRKREDK